MSGSLRVPKAIPEKQGLKLFIWQPKPCALLCPKGHSRKTRIETIVCPAFAGGYDRGPKGHSRKTRIETENLSSFVEPVAKSQRPFQKNKD